MILALIKLFLQGFVVCYCAFVVVQGLSFSTGLCSVRALKWFGFFDRLPLVNPRIIQAELDQFQYDLNGNEYTHHVFLRLSFLGLDIPFESVVGLPLNPMWNFGGLTGDRDLFNPVEVPKAEVMSGLNDYQKSKL